MIDLQQESWEPANDKKVRVKTVAMEKKQVFYLKYKNYGGLFSFESNEYDNLLKAIQKATKVMNKYKCNIEVVSRTIDVPISNDDSFESLFIR